MDFKNKVIVVTGGAYGIGRSLCEHFARAKAKVVVMDIELDRAREVPSTIGGLGVGGDVSVESDIKHAVLETERVLGPIDIFVSNAGVAFGDGPGWMAASASNESWELSWGVNVMAHVYAARAAIPAMLARGDGYILNTASAAGLLTQVGSAPYAVTKHAAVSFAEWLSITYGDRGLKVSVLCPQAVRTAMTADNPDGVASVDGMMEPEVLCDSVIETLKEENFLVLPHPKVLTLSLIHISEPTRPY